MVKFARMEGAADGTARKSIWLVPTNLDDRNVVEPELSREHRQPRTTQLRLYTISFLKILLVQFRG